MDISGVQRSMFSMMSYPSAKTNMPLKNTAIQQKNDSSATINNSEAQNPSGSSESDSKAQNMLNAASSLEDQNLEYAKSKGPLGLTYNRYQWEVNELSEYQNELLSGKHSDPYAALEQEMLSFSGTNPIGVAAGVTDSNIKLDSSGPEVILDTAPIKIYTTPPQDVIDLITESADSVGWINMVKQDTPALIGDVRNITNQTMGENYNWMDVSSEGLGLSNVGTDTDEIVSKINQAISTLNGYCGAISTVLEKVPTTGGPSPWWYVQSLPDFF